MGMKGKKRRGASAEASAVVDPLAGTAAPENAIEEGVDDEDHHLAAQCRFDDDPVPTAEEADLKTPADESHVAPGCPDAGAIDLSEFQLRPIGEDVSDRQKKYQVIVDSAVMNEIHRHGKSNTDVELCGVLIGNVYQDGAAPYLLVDGSIRGNAAVSKGTQVTFTSETWTRIHEVLEREYSDRRIVGWYHTHPGFGIFLSGMDLFIQDHFFNAPWQVAFVYDPIGGDEGMFVWRKGKSLREPHLLTGDARGARGGWLHRGVDWIKHRFAS